MQEIYRGACVAATLALLSVACLRMANAETTIAAVRDFSARVEQKKYFSDIGDEVTFYGTIQYARPGRMRWEFTRPDPSTLLIRPGEVWLIVPGIKQAQKMGPRAHAKIQDFLIGFEKPLSELKKEYGLQWGPEESLPQGRASVVKLMRIGDASSTEIWIWYDVKLGVPLRVRWVAPNGDSAVTDFFEIRVDAGVGERVFDLNIPHGYETIVQEGG